MQVALGNFWVTLVSLWMYDAYTYGLGGAGKRKRAPHSRQEHLFQGQSGHEGLQPKLQQSEPEQFWGCFGEVLGLFLIENVYEGDFGATLERLRDHFSITLCRLSSFPENTYFSAGFN